ncbi:hypothetical protein ACFX14_006058 [Malus domestica]
MRFVEVALVEPDKRVVALADAYFFPPFQPSLFPRTKGGPMIPSEHPPRQARLVVYNKRSNETSIWIVELSKVYATTEGGHHMGKVISSEVVPDFQPPVVYKPRPIETGDLRESQKLHLQLVCRVCGDLRAERSKFKEESSVRWLRVECEVAAFSDVSDAAFQPVASNISILEQ